MADTGFRPKTERLHYLDGLRAILMMQVLPVHASNDYAHGQGWFINSPDQSWILTVVTTFLSTFSMPGFFLIAGFLTYRVLGKRDHTIWLKSRTGRLIVPMITCVVFLSPLAIYAGTLSAQYGTPGAFESGFGTDFAENLAHPGQRWIGHLWFLPTMWIYAMAIWLLVRAELLNPVLDFANGVFERLKNPEMIWIGILGACLVWRLFVTGGFYVLEQKFGFGMPLDGIIDLRAWLLFIPFYLLGFMAARSNVIFENLMIVTRFRLVVIGTSMLVYLYVWPQTGFEAKVISTVMKGILAIGLTGLALALARKNLSRPNKMAATIGEASYCVYLFHYPIMVLLGVYFYDINLPPVIEFFIIASAGLGLGFILARITLRTPVLAYLFNGIPFDETRRRNERMRLDKETMLPST